VSLTEGELAELVVGKRLGPVVASTLYTALRALGPE